jgi:hypothetical protein
MRHARSPLTDVRSRTPREAALKRGGRAAEENLVDLHGATTAGAAA